jgi:hypothetical protein
VIPGITLDPLGGGVMIIRYNSVVVGRLVRGVDRVWRVFLDGWDRPERPEFGTPQDAKVWLRRLYDTTTTRDPRRPDITTAGSAR